MRSRIFLLFEIPYMTSYLTSIDTFSLYRTVVEIFGRSRRFWGLTSTLDFKSLAYLGFQKGGGGPIFAGH